MYCTRTRVPSSPVRCLKTRSLRPHVAEFAAATEQPVINIYISSSSRFDREPLLCDASTFPAHVLTTNHIGEQLGESPCHCLVVSHRGQIPGFPFHYDALRTAATGGDDWNPAGHRFRQHDTEPLFVRWQSKQRCFSIQLGELLDGRVLAKLDVWRDAELSRYGPILRSRPSGPGKN